MNKILYKKQLSQNVFSMVLEAPLIARERKPGQFIIVQLGGDFGERIPLTIADADAEKGTISLIIQAVGVTTLRLVNLNVGEYVANVLGPLGHPTPIKKYGKVIGVGGGIGVAPLHPVVQALKAIGNEVKIVIGARSKELIVMEKELRVIDPDLTIVTDDGSYGKKALVTEPLKEACETWKPDLAIAMGPPIMMKFCAATTRPFNVHTLVSLNTIMIDGTGMCGGCRVNVGDETKFVCVDGPDFDGHLVDWDNMMLRLGTYRAQEQEADHRCRVGLNK
ncbi:sulfide/dihydroorotate dehydrogenase-like FAD/NAD-binding protein [Parasphaerochaeta coccoides]|uniref:Sulfide dehydrogenase (Flavoprotein) subunit SudB n=1 Tax=Parasphaerochaeta coccoides (strain ATCC BAA-1237 / DSM 17374 / SPN1) TaxID=760011 RepID=F4GKE3_PARC1|nr:sulfide/dihydroorotate dehydrogenase-like FAD/NAD-binding protein [Parasphaerochaeta coccoides]AEC02339.1 sulfide dehydrogenase (flavoprotein) subunit SudB [Parasphaerochaeta coccoides DSM 17374]